MLQAYYGPRVAVPTYFNSAVGPGHTPHPYMWGPQVLSWQKCFSFVVELYQLLCNGTYRRTSSAS